MIDIIKLSSPQTHEYWEIPILYEDDSLLVIEKPPRMPICPNQNDSSKANLMTLMHNDIDRGALWTTKHKITFLSNVYRMDPEISGILLLAKSKSVQLSLGNQFSAEKPLLSYWVLVRGSNSPEEFSIDLKIAPHPTRPGMMRIDRNNGKKSISLFKVHEKFTGFFLLRCQPLTDRNHQIRIHLLHKRLRVVGDPLYGSSPLYLSDIKSKYRHKEQEKERPLLGRVAIHLEQINFLHPIMGTLVCINSELSHDFQVALKYLRKFAQHI